MRFNNSQAGVEKMDAICMMLIVIGEALKKLDKVTGGELLPEYPQVDWKKAKGIAGHSHPPLCQCKCRSDLLYLQGQNTPA